MGTGCVFNRTALYGYEPPIKVKHKKPSVFSKLCGGSRKKNSKSKNESDKKKSGRHDSTVPVFNLDDIEEGVEGTKVLNLLWFSVIINMLVFEGLIHGRGLFIIDSS